MNTTAETRKISANNYWFKIAYRFLSKPKYVSRCKLFWTLVFATFIVNPFHWFGISLINVLAMPFGYRFFLRFDGTDVDSTSKNDFIPLEPWFIENEKWRSLPGYVILAGIYLFSLTNQLWLEVEHSRLEEILYRLFLAAAFPLVLIGGVAALYALFELFCFLVKLYYFLMGNLSRKIDPEEETLIGLATGAVRGFYRNTICPIYVIDDN